MSVLVNGKPVSEYSKNGNKYIIKQKIVKIDMENVKKLYWEKK